MGDYSTYFKLEKEDYVAVVTLNRPQKVNTIAQPFYEAQLDLQQDLIRDKSIRCICMLAEGKHFSAGTDLEYFASSAGSAKEPGRLLYNLQHWQRSFAFWQTNGLPVIAGIHGACLGSGVELAAACDVRVCADNAYFFLGEVKVGMSTDLGGVTHLTRLIGPAQTKRLLWTAEKFDAQEALRIGLVEKLVPAAELRQATLDMARTVAHMPPIAVQLSKRCINLSRDASYEASLLAEQLQSLYCTGTKDKGQAIKAMVDKSFTPTYTYE